MRFMTLVTNLMLLNLLWIVTSLPLFTLGASMSAMYHVVFLYVTKQDESLVKPYFRAFKQSFKQATLVWIPHMLLGLVLVAELYYLSRNETAAIWWVLFGALVALFLLISALIYPMIGRYENTTRNILINSTNLAIRNLFTMFCVVILGISPLALFIILPDMFLYTALFWTFGGFSLIAYVNGIMIMRIFKKYEPKEE